MALSFAGEDREYVKQVAKHLDKLGVTVFYDRDKTAELWGEDLAVHLGNRLSGRFEDLGCFTNRC